MKNAHAPKPASRAGILLLALLSLAAPVAAADVDIDWKPLMVTAEGKRDAKGMLLPLQSYGETIQRGMRFLLEEHLQWFKGPPENLQDEQGHTQMPWVYYSNLQHNGAPFTKSVDRFVSYPAFHHALMIRTFLGYWRYAGDKRALDEAVKLADWEIAHRTPADWPYGNLPWSTFQEKKPGGFRDQSGLMPDKAAIMGLAYLQLHEATHEARFLKAAEAIAHTLAARQRENGTWPFRVDPKTEAVIEEYTSSVIYAVRLFESLGKLNGSDRYQAHRDKTWNWLVNGPIKTKEFRGFYEDIPASPQGRTNYDCLDTIRYLLANRTDTNGYLDMAKDLNAWVEKTFMDRISGFEPAEGIREQLQCNVVMGIHSLNWAAMLLELAKATADGKLEHRARQTANYITYYLQPDNRIVVGFQYHQWWYSCHAGVVLYLLDFAGLPARSEEAVTSIRHSTPLRSTAEPFQSGGFARAPEGALDITHAPAPLFRDPLTDGAADPSVVWNAREKAWYVFYTQRRANMDLPAGQNWTMGTKIGIAKSADQGRSWKYVGTARGLSRGLKEETFWAPHVFEDNGTYHLFVTYIPKIVKAAKGQPEICHYTSRDLIAWEFSDVADVKSDDIIDPAVVKLRDGRWLMVFRDCRKQNRTAKVVGTDLKNWQRLDDLTGDGHHEAPVVLFWRNKFWMFIDEWKGIGVYESDDGIRYARNNLILDLAGKRADDGYWGSHPGVALAGDRAFIFYHCHAGKTIGAHVPARDQTSLEFKRSSLQAAEIELYDGKITCDRDKAFRKPEEKP